MANMTINSPQPSGIQYIEPRQTVFAGTPVILQAPASINRGLDRQLLPSLKALSIVQIINGALSICFDVALLVYHAPIAIGSGIWCGLFFLVAGILGVVGAAQNTTCLLIATLAMSILSSIMLFVLIGFNGAVISYCSVDRWYGPLYDCESAEYAFASLLIVISVVELIVSIWASILCCKGVCQFNNQLGTPYTTQPAYYTVQNSMGSQMTVVPPTGVTVMQSPAFTPAVHQIQIQAPYPQQQYAAGYTSYAAGAAGPPPY